MTTATSSPRPIRAAGPAPGTSKTWFRLRPIEGNRRKTGSSRPPAPRPRSAPWSAPTVASSPPPNRSQRPPNRPPQRARSRSPAPFSSLESLPPPNPSPSIPRPLSFLLAHQGQGVRMQARPRSLPPLSLAAALLGRVRAAARAAGPRHRPDRAARASGDRPLPHRPLPRSPCVRKRRASRSHLALSPLLAGSGAQIVERPGWRVGPDRSDLAGEVAQVRRASRRRASSACPRSSVPLTVSPVGDGDVCGAAPRRAAGPASAKPRPRRRRDPSRSTVLGRRQGWSGLPCTSAATPLPL